MAGKQQQYKSELIKQLYYGKDMSCAELSELTQKSVPLITRTLAELVHGGLVKETGYALSTGGRRPKTYSLEEGTMYVMAVAMDQLTTRISMMDLRNNLVTPPLEYSLPLANNPDALHLLAGIMDDFLNISGIHKRKVLGVGIGMPGFVDVTKGVNHSFLSGPEKINIRQFLQQAIDIPVFIDNDSSLIALAEHRFGMAKGRRNVMVVNIGWGVGLGLILDHELFRGDSGFAGEFSHIPLFTNNKLCSCGKLGCLETETSLKVLVERGLAEKSKSKITALSRLSGKDTDLDKDAAIIIDAAVAGDRVAVDILSRLAYDVGRGIAILIHILNPGMILLSGRGASAGNMWLAPVQHAINQNCIPKIAENIVVKVSNLGKKAEIIGAAALVVDNLDWAMLSRVSSQKESRVKS